MFETGHFAGALVATAVLTAAFSWLLQKQVSSIIALLAANALSLGAATILAGYGNADGGDPDFGAALALYALPQLFWLVACFVHLSRRREETLQASIRERREPPPLAHTSLQGTKETGSDPAISETSPTAGAHSDHWHNNLTQPIQPPAAIARSARTFISRHWRGQFSLGMSYWGIAALGNIAVVVVVAGLGAAFSVDKGYAPSRLFWLLTAIWAFVAVVVVWQTVGTWRAASNHAIRRTAIGKGTGWATVAKVALSIGLASSVGQFANAGRAQLKEAFDIAFNGDPSIPAYSLRVMRDGTEIEVVGGFKYGLTDDFERVVKASPRIRVVHLHSNGGRIGEGERLFNAIKARGMTTYVSSICQSACTLAYAAGKERWISREGRLGFHGPAFPGMTAADFSGVIGNWKGLLVTQSIDGAFVDRALAVPSADMWRPTLAELTTARVVTNVADGSQFAASGYGATVTNREIGEQLAKFLPAIAAMQVRFPSDFAAIRDAYFDGYQAGQSEAQLISLVRGKLLPMIEAHKAKAEDAVLIDYARVAMEQYMALAQKNPTMCYRYAAFGGGNLNISAEVPAGLIQREIALGERVIMTSAPRAPLNDQTVGVLLTRVFGALAKKFSAEKLALLKAKTVDPVRHGDYCALSIAMYQEILAMRPSEAGMLLRSFQTRR